jgi:riboflavin biosynthesis pyrimidine reductase
LAIADGTVYANFVSSIDGIVALEGGTAASGSIISGRNESDRFVMGLLRAFADAVLVGAGTVRAEGARAMWTPEYVFPAARESFAALRQSLKRQRTPRLVIVSARGDLDPSHQALQAGALVLTTMAAAPQLRKALPQANDVRAISEDERVGVDEIFDVLASEGYRTILTEGGPHLFGQLVARNRVDELFLTVAPKLVGHQDRSFGIIRGVDFGRTFKSAQLLSIRQADSYLFLRYQLGPLSSPAGGGG